MDTKNLEGVIEALESDRVLTAPSHEPLCQLTIKALKEIARLLASIKDPLVANPPTWSASVAAPAVVEKEEPKFDKYEL